MRTCAVAAGLAVLAAAELAIADNGSAPPADDQQGVLSEVLVTSQRSEQSLQDVPISVEVFSQERLDAQGARSIDDLTRLTPGVNFQRNGASLDYNGESSDIAVRGIQSSAGPQTTAIYIDDIPIQGRHLQFGTLNAYPALFDLERVEILRGPQGTLFGAGAEGGAIRYITPEPGLFSDTAYVRSELATTDDGAPSYELGAALGGPISTGTLGFRLSASYRMDGGWVDRVDSNTGAVITPNSNWQQTYTLRAALTYAPSATFTITPSVYFQELYVHDTGNSWSTLSNASTGPFRNGNVVNDPSSDPFVLPATKIQWDIGAVRLTSNTAYLDRWQHSTSDYTEFDRIVITGDPFPPAGSVGVARFTDRQTNLTEELRVQPVATDLVLSWQLGLFYGHDRENTTQFTHDPSLPADVQQEIGINIGPLLPGGYFFIQSPFEAVDTQLALFGEAAYSIRSNLQLIAGVRVAHQETFGDSLFEYPAQIAGPPIASRSSLTENPVTPRFGLDYRPDSGTLLYFTAAKGYRVGGANSGLPPVCNTELSELGDPKGVPATYGSDSLWSYELGLKQSLDERRLQIDASAYWIDWRNVQQNIFLPVCGFEFTANLGQVVSKGADLDLQARPVSALTADLQLAYTDAAYNRTIRGTTANVVTAGDHLPSAPWTVTASAEYVFSALDGYVPYARVDYQLGTSQSSATQTQDPRNVTYDPAIPLLPQTRALAARTGYRLAGLDISLFGNNLLNTHPLLYRAHDTIGSPLFYDYTWRPLTVGLTAIYRY